MFDGDYLFEVFEVIDGCFEDFGYFVDGELFDELIFVKLFWVFDHIRYFRLLRCFDYFSDVLFSRFLCKEFFVIILSLLYV